MYEDNIIRIHLTLLRNQAFRIFVEGKFYGLLTIAISQQYYQGNITDTPSSSSFICLIYTIQKIIYSVYS